MSVTQLQDSKRIRLVRCENGWLAHDIPAHTVASGDISPNAPIFVFESTAALAKGLHRLIGESTWKVEPERDEKGHFKTKES